MSGLKQGDRVTYSGNLTERHRDKKGTIVRMGPPAHGLDVAFDDGSFGHGLAATSLRLDTTPADPVAAAVKLLKDKGYKVEKPEFKSIIIKPGDASAACRGVFFQIYDNRWAFGGHKFTFEEFDKVAQAVKEAREFTKNNP